MSGCKPATPSPEEARLWARTGVLAAFALVLSYIETFIPLPVPVPGAKLGLANIPLLMALKVLDGRSALIVAVIKTLVTGLLFGSPIMIPYSAAGTLLALAAMWLLVRVPGLHVVLVSVIGSIFHIVGQLAMATLLMGTALVWCTFPLLALIACATGALTGWVAWRLIGCLQEGVESGQGAARAVEGRTGLAAAQAASLLGADAPSSPLGRLAARVDARWLLAAFAAYVVVVLCASNATILAICALLALAAVVAARVTAREGLRAAVPLLSILVVTAIAQVLYAQQGHVIAQLGPVAITEQAVEAIGFMFARLLCIMGASVAFARAVPFRRVSAALARLLRPLGRFGLRADAFVLALDTALQFIPVLLADFEELRAQAVARDPSFGTGGLASKVRAYQSLIVPLAVRSFAYADRLAAQPASLDRFAPEALAAEGVEALGLGRARP